MTAGRPVQHVSVHSSLMQAEDVMWLKYAGDDATMLNFGTTNVSSSDIST